MYIPTLDEVRAATHALPTPQIAASMGMYQMNRAIPQEIPLGFLDLDNPDPVGPKVRYITFRLLQFAEGDRTWYEWVYEGSVRIR